MRFYKGLFGPPEDDSVRMDMSRREDITQVSDEENTILTKKIHGK
jgi:hypothetical protein